MAVRIILGGARGTVFGRGLAGYALEVSGAITRRSSARWRPLHRLVQARRADALGRAWGVHRDSARADIPPTLLLWVRYLN